MRWHQQSASMCAKLIASLIHYYAAIYSGRHATRAFELRTPYIHHHNKNRVIHSFGTLAGVKPIQHSDTHTYLAFKREMIFELERERKSKHESENNRGE